MCRGPRSAPTCRGLAPRPRPWVPVWPPRSPKVTTGSQDGRREGPAAEGTASTCLRCPHQDLSLLLIFPLFFDLIELLKKLELSPDVACLLVPVVILQRW